MKKKRYETLLHQVEENKKECERLRDALSRLVDEFRDLEIKVESLELEQLRQQKQKMLNVVLDDDEERDE